MGRPALPMPAIAPDIAASSPHDSTLRSMSITRHTLYNLAGLGAPLLVALVSIPPLIALLGVARFGLLALLWAVVSYFGLFDLGLGRALTQRLAATQARRADEAGAIVGSALLLMVLLGIVAGAVLAALTPWGVGRIAEVPDPGESVRAVLWMALTVPAVVVTAGLRGVLEARHKFGWVNLIRLPMGLWTFLGPLAVAVWSGPRLDWIAAVLALGRALALLAHAGAAWAAMPAGTRHLRVERAQLRPLLASGGWLTVGNIIGPLMGYADRFIIAATVSASAVAYYATPHELVTKLWIVPGALSAVLFPTFAAMTSGRAADETAGPPAWALALLGVRWLFVVLVPVTLALALFAREALGWWIGAEFAIYSAPVLQLLALGVLINCLAHVPLTLLQGAGQARAPALLQAVQILPYVALLWWLTQTHGVIAAAALWLARMVLDTLAMFWLCSRDHGGLRRWQPGRAAYFAGGLSLMAFAATLASLPLATRSVLWVATVVAVAALLAPWRHTVGWSKATRS